MQFETFTADNPLFVPETGAADYLPAYAGNLDIMTGAAKTTAERIALHTSRTAGASA